MVVMNHRYHKELDRRMLLSLWHIINQNKCFFNKCVHIVTPKSQTCLAESCYGVKLLPLYQKA